MIGNNIPTAHHYTVSSFEEFDANRLRYPIIVKPADCLGSKGVRKIEKDDVNTEAYIRDALGFSRSGHAIIEEYIVGREIGADCMIVNHKAHVVITRERRKINKNNKDAIQQIYGSFWPADLTENQIEQLRLIAEKIADIFDLPIEIVVERLRENTYELFDLK